MAELEKFPGIRNNQPSALISLEKYWNDLTSLWADINTHDALFAVRKPSSFAAFASS